MAPPEEEDTLPRRRDPLVSGYPVLMIRLD
jgi:hypothetical protein